MGAWSLYWRAGPKHWLNASELILHTSRPSQVHLPASCIPRARPPRSLRGMETFCSAISISHGSSQPNTRDAPNTRPQTPPMGLTTAVPSPWMTNLFVSPLAISAPAGAISFREAENYPLYPGLLKPQPREVGFIRVFSQVFVSPCTAYVVLILCTLYWPPGFLPFRCSSPWLPRYLRPVSPLHCRSTDSSPILVGHSFSLVFLPEREVQRQSGWHFSITTLHVFPGLSIRIIQTTLHDAPFARSCYHFSRDYGDVVGGPWNGWDVSPALLFLFIADTCSSSMDSVPRLLYNVRRSMYVVL